MNKIKQVIIWRKDLKVRLGKKMAQSAHASMKVFFDRMKIQNMFTPSRLGIKNINNNAIHDFTPEMIEWMQGSFTKIVVGVDSLEQLLDLEKQAKEANIPYALIEDNGATEFYSKETCILCNGQGNDLTIVGPENACKECDGLGFIKINKKTITCLAIGPDRSEKIDPITKELKLL